MCKKCFLTHSYENGARPFFRYFRLTGRTMSAVRRAATLLGGSSCFHLWRASPVITKSVPRAIVRLAGRGVRGFSSSESDDTSSSGSLASPVPRLIGDGGTSTSMASSGEAIYDFFKAQRERRRRGFSIKIINTNARGSESALVNRYATVDQSCPSVSHNTSYNHSGFAERAADRPCNAQARWLADLITAVSLTPSS